MSPSEIRTAREKAWDLSGRSVEVIIGSKPNQTTFSVHENLICSESEFFRTAMGGHWAESESRTVKFEDQDPEVFQIYLNWLYREKLPVRNDNPGHEGNAEYIQLAKAYVLGDFLQDRKFKNAVIDSMISKAGTLANDGARWYPVGEVLNIIYGENTMESCGARRLLIDFYTQTGHGKWLEEWTEQENIPKAFLYDLAISLLDKRTFPGLTGFDPARYHD